MYVCVCIYKISTLSCSQVEEAKKVEAVASYEAWKEKKAEILRLEAKERLERSRKEQRELEEREEKKLSAKQVGWCFHDWKRCNNLFLIFCENLDIQHCRYMKSGKKSMITC